MNKIFFELIRVAIGTSESLSHIPKPKEWKQLYEMAKKQSLVGICFAGIQKLVDSEKEDYCGMPEMLYLTWMGMAAKIQQRNEVVNRQCVELCSNLEKEGFRTCILKGQGTAALYWVSRDARLEVSENGIPNSLTTNPSTLTYIGALRQSGDIDVWVMPKDVRTVKKSRPRIDEMVHRRFPDEKGAFVHIGYPCFQETEVEVHYVPTMDGNPWVDRRFRRLFEESQDECFTNVNELGFAVPEPMVNVLFNLHHIKRHFISSGVGLRHVIDLYFVLKSMDENPNENENLLVWIKKLGMERFFAGMLWVMQEVLFNSNSDSNSNENDNFVSKKNSNLSTLTSNLGIKPDARLGKFILQEIMQGGNFGHHDERQKDVGRMSFGKRWKAYMEVSMVRFRYFPMETLWSWMFRMKVGIWHRFGIEL